MKVNCISNNCNSLLFPSTPTIAYNSLKVNFTPSLATPLGIYTFKLSLKVSLGVTYESIFNVEVVDNLVILAPAISTAKYLHGGSPPYSLTFPAPYTCLNCFGSETWDISIKN